MAALPSDLEKVIEGFSTKVNGLVDAFAGKLEAMPPPPVIYHYTDGAGLRGILESGKLWFTDILGLNDPSELKYGINLAVDHMKSAAATGMPEAKQFADNFAAIVAGGIEEVAHFFVCCFSRNGDDLGQWRAYADNGRGYAIGFDGEMLETNFGKPGGIVVPNHASFPITYEDTALREMHRQVIDEVTPLVSLPRKSGFDQRFIGEYMSELSIVFALPILRSAIFFKHGAYTNEAEYRFLDLRRAGPVDAVKYRSRPYSLITYREFDWRGVAPNALKKIIIGPAADRALAMRFVDDCLRAFLPPRGTVEIKNSTIPYRAP